MYAMNTLAVMMQPPAAQKNIQAGSDTKNCQQAGQSEENSSFQDLLHQKAEHPNGRPATSQNKDGDSSPVLSQDAETPPLQQELAAAMVAQHFVIMPVEVQNVADAVPAATALPLAVAAAVPVQLEPAPAPQQPQQAPAPMPQADAPQIPASSQPVQPQAQVPSQPLPQAQGKAPIPGQQAQIAEAETVPTQQLQADPAQTVVTAKPGTAEQEASLSKGDAEPLTAKQPGTVQEAPAQPLFRELEGAPVKVGEAPAADTAAPDFEQQLAKQLNSGLEQGAQKIEIKLSPENLGSLMVELTRSQDGALRVVLNTTTEKAAKLLGEHAAGLGSLLRGSVQAPVQVEVQQQQSQQQDGQDRQGHEQQHNHQQEQHQQRQQQAQQSQDFLQQLRLGLVPLDIEVS